MQERFVPATSIETEKGAVIAATFGYRFGKYLGGFTAICYVTAALLGIVAGGFGLGVLTGLAGWQLWAIVIPAALLILWFVPRPVDVILLAPLAIYGAAQNWGLTYTMAGIMVGIPVLLVLILSLGKK
ncbi:MAG: hypothetical protein HKN36_04835 [Hellea sp.]|nr:hypothetical protein [Hellea sp.]